MLNVRVKYVDVVEPLVKLAERFDAEVYNDRFFLPLERGVQSRRQNGAKLLHLLDGDTHVPALNGHIRNELMDVARTQQHEVAGHQRINRSVDEVRARSVDCGSEFPIAVTVHDAVVVPQKSVDFVGLQLGYGFLNGSVLHKRILPVFAYFVNISSSEYEK